MPKVDTKLYVLYNTLYLYQNVNKYTINTYVMTVHIETNDEIGNTDKHTRHKLCFVQMRDYLFLPGLSKLLTAARA